MWPLPIILCTITGFVPSSTTIVPSVVSKLSDPSGALQDAAIPRASASEVFTRYSVVPANADGLFICMSPDSL